MKRRDFVRQLSYFSLLSAIPGEGLVWPADDFPVSEFSGKLRPVGRALEMEGYYVWCNSPIKGPDGKIHVFFSRWSDKKGMGGWINSSEIAHAVASSPEAPFELVGTILAPRGAGYWDATTCHNPHIKLVDGKYCLFYMGNSNGKTDTKRIGLATSDSLYGPWKRPDLPLLEAGPAGAWEDHCTTNPSFIKHPNGEYWLYYKSWNTEEYEQAKGQPIRGNRKYGLAIAKKLEGPYVRYEGNPVIDFSSRGGNKQFEDAFIWLEGRRFKLLARDMGVFNHEAGLYLESRDGKKWGEPEVAYRSLDNYVQEPPAPRHLKRYGRLERPQLLFDENRPAYLFTAAQGGKYMTSSAFIFKIEK
ncbi:glycoside hydrolase family protein [Arcticibacter sp. MXS-1]|uniref:glycoside hydrolase family protein n=1 Tax=Arcticibacter sp. MXS-1 TaxID=3341726 RepID=UPI0035A81DB6